MTASLHITGQIGRPVTNLRIGRILPRQAMATAIARNTRNVALFLAAPFIGLVYALMMPVIGLGMLAWIGGKALATSPAIRRVMAPARNVVLLVAAPLIGLAYALLLPVLGIAMIAGIGFQACATPELAA